MRHVPLYFGFWSFDGEKECLVTFSYSEKKVKKLTYCGVFKFLKNFEVFGTWQITVCSGVISNQLKLKHWRKWRNSIKIYLLNSRSEMQTTIREKIYLLFLLNRKRSDIIKKKKQKVNFTFRCFLLLLILHVLFTYCSYYSIYCLLDITCRCILLSHCCR